MTVYSTIDAAVSALRHADTERPTLLDLPEHASGEQRAKAYADLAFVAVDRSRRLTHLLQLMNEEHKAHADYVEKRLDRIEEQLSQLVTLVEGALRREEA